ncbi:hypothetical protein F2P81_008419 [Scophthalmus maximus]|uniref:Uncharacterized protein n=1 Tax=Scophthalmus maximus TaxID=52904 RepID=A0A6A4TAL0_SCOMX|nr:hypothetical protein F2P81_008419 [Scophthalmus maximus]
MKAEVGVVVVRVGSVEWRVGGLRTTTARNQMMLPPLEGRDEPPSQGKIDWPLRQQWLVLAAATLRIALSSMSWNVNRGRGLFSTGQNRSPGTVLRTERSSRKRQRLHSCLEETGEGLDRHERESISLWFRFSTTRKTSGCCRHSQKNLRVSAGHSRSRERTSASQIVRGRLGGVGIFISFVSYISLKLLYQCSAGSHEPKRSSDLHPPPPPPPPPPTGRPPPTFLLTQDFIMKKMLHSSKQSDSVTSRVVRVSEGVVGLIVNYYYY